MKNGKLVIGIIGMSFGTFHLRGALDRDIEIGAICDKYEPLLKERGDQYKIPEEKRFTDYKDILNNPEIDAVVLALPDQLHRPMTEEFLAAGKHVLCEKPVALTKEDVKAMIKASKAGKARCMVGQICRFTPAFVKAKEIVASGKIGEVYYIESEYAHDYMTIVSDRQAWRSDPLRHGVIGGGCHAVDLIRWIAGDPSEVFAYGSHKLLPMVPYDDATVSVMKFPSGAIGKVFVSTGCKRNYTMRTVIYGTKGTIICDNKSDTMELFTVNEKDITIEPAEVIPVEVNNHNAGEEITVFLNAIQKGEDFMMSVEEGGRSAATCFAIVDSAKKGVPVAPDYDFEN